MKHCKLTYLANASCRTTSGPRRDHTMLCCEMHTIYDQKRANDQEKCWDSDDSSDDECNNKRHAANRGERSPLTIAPMWKIYSPNVSFTNSLFDLFFVSHPQPHLPTATKAHNKNDQNEHWQSFLQRSAVLVAFELTAELQVLPLQLLRCLQAFLPPTTDGNSLTTNPNPSRTGQSK